MPPTPTDEEKRKSDTLKSILEEIIQRLHKILSKHDSKIKIEIIGINFAKKIRLSVRQTGKTDLLKKIHALINENLNLPVEKIEKVGKEYILISVNRNLIDKFSKLLKKE